MDIEKLKKLREWFEKRNLQNSKGRVNEGIWKIFARLNNTDDALEKTYILAEEINAIIVAISSLDNHICRLMG